MKNCECPPEINKPDSVDQKLKEFGWRVSADSGDKNIEGRSAPSKFELATEKFKKYGWFDLTAEDNENIGSSPESRLLENPGKARYELLTDSETEEYLNRALRRIDKAGRDAKLFEKNGLLEVEKNFLKTAIPFLRSVNHLPKKFENFDLLALDK